MKYWYAKNNATPLKATVDMGTLSAAGGAQVAKVADVDEEIEEAGEMVADKKKEAKELITKTATGGVG